mgnify:CR=1 FL=1
MDWVIVLLKHLPYLILLKCTERDNSKAQGSKVRCDCSIDLDGGIAKIMISPWARRNEL